MILLRAFEEVDHEAIVLDHEAGELEAPDDPVGVGVVHVLVVDRHVVLGCHVVSDVVVHDQPEKHQRYCHLSNLLFNSPLRLFFLTPLGRSREGGNPPRH